jgi:mannose/cellobiose epimerase-like protein (N-acyl-D-glucosamine 2-epimerase family)
MLRAAVFALVLSFVQASAQADLAPRDWLDHVEHDLAGFWMQEDLAGDPVGSFPTFICADGRPFKAAAPCPSFADAPPWIRSELGRQYIRMVSRQVYTYGVIYHMTGNETALARARAGTRFIMQRAWDRDSGSVTTYLIDGKPQLKPGQNTTQSLAYALVGPAFYYYLTRDAETLVFINSVRRRIFDQYWSKEWGMLRWTLQDAGDDTADRKELVAQLDQINAYMLLLLPLLDEQSRPAWESDLRRLVDVMLRDFHNTQTRRFYGYIHDKQGTVWGERHNDFGHTTKAYWMLLLAGQALRKESWVDLARAGIEDALGSALVRRNIADAPAWQAPVMRRAADHDGVYYVWSNKPDGIGIAWWEWCELDQAAATMALSEPRYREYLDKTYPTYFATLVDPLHGGTYAFPGAVNSAKGHQWQNGYHASEHALVGYITSAMQRGEPFRLYFAFPDTKSEPAAPAYYFAARESGRRAMERLDGGLRKVRVTYGRQ